MPDDLSLGIRLTGQDVSFSETIKRSEERIKSFTVALRLAQEEATNNLRALRGELQGLQAAQTEFSTQPRITPFDPATASEIRRVTGEIRQEITALKELEAEWGKVKTRAQEAEISQAVATRGARAAAGRVEGLLFPAPAVSGMAAGSAEAFRQHPQIAIGTFPQQTRIAPDEEALALDQDRRIKSARQSAAVFTTGLHQAPGIELPPGITRGGDVSSAEAYGQAIKNQASALATANLQAKEYTATIARLKAEQLGTVVIGETGGVLQQRAAEVIASRSGRIESEAGIASAVTEHEINAVANAEALAQAKVRQAQAQELANRQIAQEAQFQREALATEFQMNAAANAEAELLRTRTVGAQAYRESINSIRQAEEGAASAAKYRAEIESVQARQRADLLSSQRGARGYAIGGYTPGSSPSEGIEQAAQAYARTETALAGVSRVMREYSSGTIGAHEATTKLGFAFRELAVEAGEFARGQRGQEISTFLAAMRRLGVGAAPIFIAPFAAGFAALRIAALTKEYSELAAKTDDAARAAGIGVEQYSRLQRVLQLSGVDSAKLASAMGQLSQSMRTAVAEPLGAKGTAFAEILGEDFFTQLPKLMEDPLTSIDLLRKKYQDLSQTVGQFQAMGAFRTALGRTEWLALSTAITSTDEEWRKWNKDVEDSHLPFTGGEVEKLREYDLATRKLTEDWESLGKQVAILATNSGFISWLDSVVIKLREMVRLHPGEVITELTGAVLGAGAGFAAAGPLGVVPGAVVGAGGGFTATRTARGIEAATQTPGMEVVPGGPLGGGMMIPTPAQAPEESAFSLIPSRPVPSEASTRALADRARVSSVTPPSEEEGRRYPQLYGGPGTELSPQALITEATKYREEIEQAHRLVQSRLEAEKAQATDLARSESEKNQVQGEFIQKELQNRAQARQEEETMLGLYRQRLQDVPPAIRPMAERELGQRVGVQIQTEEFATQRRAAEEQTRMRAEDFRIFSDTERERIQAARGSWVQISGIYQEWLERAKSQFGESSTEYQTVLREMVRASQEATDKLISDRIRGADTEFSVLESQARLRETQRETGQIGTTVGRPQRAQGFRQEIIDLEAVAAKEEALYSDIASMAGATAEQKIAALEKAARVAETTADREAQVARKVAEEQKKAAEEGAKVYTEAFNKAGTEAEGLLDAAIFRTKTRQEAFRDFFLSLDKTIIHSVETIGSQLAAQGIAKATGTELAPGKGLGDLFGAMVGKLFGGREKADAQSALIAAQTATTGQIQISNQFLNRIQELISQQKQSVGQVQGDVSRTTGAGAANVPMTGQYADTISNAAQAYNVPPQVLYNLIRAESGFDPRARSSTGAQGLGQFTPRTAREYGVDVNDPTSSIYGSAHYLSDLQRQTGSWTNAISAYNRGPGGAIASGYSLSGYEGYGSGRDLIASARAADTGSPVPVTIVGGERAAPGVPTQGELSHVNIAQVGGTDVTTPVLPTEQDTARELGVGHTLAPASPPGLVERLSSFEGTGVPGPGLQFGGPIPPNSTDTIPAWLSPGEFVVKKDAVDHYGTGALHALNSKSLPKFQDGGEVPGREAGGEIISFPFAGSPAEQLQRRIQIEQVKENPDYSKIREWGSTESNLSRLWKPGMAPKGFQEGGLLELDETLTTARTPPLRGFSFRPESLGEYTGEGQLPTYKSAEEASLRLRFAEIEYWKQYGVGLREKFGGEDQGIAAGLLEAERVAPVRGTDILQTSGRFDPYESKGFREFLGVGPPPVYPGVLPLEFIQQRERATGFQSGGLAPISPISTTSIPVQTESRGFLTPHLVQAFPQPRLGPLLAILGIAGVGLGATALIEKLTKDDQDAISKKLLAQPETTGGTQVTSESATPLATNDPRLTSDTSLSPWYSLSQTSSWPKFHTGGMVQSFQRGGVSKEILNNLRSDETLGVLQTHERVLSRDEAKAYDSVPKFHTGGVVRFAGGGYVWPAFQSGGSVDPGSSITYSPPVTTSDASSKTALQEVSGLATSMGTLAGDVEKVSKGFSSLEKGTAQAQSSTTRLSTELSAASSAVSGFQSILSTFGGGGTGGGGSILGTGASILGGVAKVAGLFALEQGGIIPSAMRGMIVGGLPHFANGGILSMLHQQEMVLPAHISNFIQGAAANYTGTKGQAQDLTGGNIHNTFNISGVVNAHDVRQLFMQHYGTIMRAFQRGARNGFDTP